MEVVSLFAGISSVEKIIKRNYADEILPQLIDSILKDIHTACESNTYYDSFNPTENEYVYASHLADLDILELFVEMYVRYNRRYKYSKGRPDTTNNIASTLRDNGIFVSADTVSSWKRSKNRSIAHAILDRILELVHFTPNDRKALVFAHILCQRTIQTEKSECKIILFPQVFFNRFFGIQSKIISARGPCIA